MADETKTKLIEQIKQQGDLVRKLKSEKTNSVQVLFHDFQYLLRNSLFSQLSFTAYGAHIVEIFLLFA